MKERTASRNGVVVVVTVMAAAAAAMFVCFVAWAGSTANTNTVTPPSSVRLATNKRRLILDKVLQEELGPLIVSLALVNAVSKQTIQSVESGQAVTVDVPRPFNLQAVIAGNTARSVLLEHSNGKMPTVRTVSRSGGRRTTVNSVLLCRDDRLWFPQWRYRQCLDALQTLGTHTVSATPYRWYAWGMGTTAGEKAVVSFTLMTANGTGSGSEGNTTITNTNVTNPMVPGTNATTSKPTSNSTPPLRNNSTNKPNNPPVTCKVPLFEGDWQDRDPEYPLNVAEAQGAMMNGHDLVIVSGFHNRYEQSTAQVYALDTRRNISSGASWRRMDDLPLAVGLTHGAFAVANNDLFFLCGGYVGGHPGLDTAQCWVYNHSIAPAGKMKSQWSKLPSLPSGRAGGGLIYDKRRNALVYASGARRPKAGNPDAVDYNSTWMYTLPQTNVNNSNSSASWVRQADLPFAANHMSSVTVLDPSTRQERHYFLGGQVGENEHTGNVVHNYEWDATRSVWIPRRSLPLSRGHAASSTRAVGCGFVIAGGSTNEQGQTADISYYDVVNDTWTSIGKLPNAINTPVCDMSSDGYMYCESGWTAGTFSYRRKMVW